MEKWLRYQRALFFQSIWQQYCWSALIGVPFIGFNKWSLRRSFKQSTPTPANWALCVGKFIFPATPQKRPRNILIQLRDSHCLIADNGMVNIGYLDPNGTYVVMCALCNPQQYASYTHEVVVLCQNFLAVRKQDWSLQNQVYIRSIFIRILH